MSPSKTTRSRLFKTRLRAPSQDPEIIANITDSSLLIALEDLRIDGRGRRAPRPFEHTNYKSQLATTKGRSQDQTLQDPHTNNDDELAQLRAQLAVRDRQLDEREAPRSWSLS